MNLFNFLKSGTLRAYQSRSTRRLGVPHAIQQQLIERAQAKRTRRCDRNLDCALRGAFHRHDATWVWF